MLIRHNARYLDTRRLPFSEILRTQTSDTSDKDKIFFLFLLSHRDDVWVIKQMTDSRVIS